MKLSGFYADSTKFRIISGSAIFVFCLLIFQNCGRIVLSDKLSAQTSASALTAIDVEATDIISTMISAGIKDSNEYNEMIEYSAAVMTCGTKVGSTKIECTFQKNSTQYVASNSTAVNVRNFLINRGIALDCPTCTEAQSYTVKNINCIKDPKYPRDASCSFNR